MKILHVINSMDLGGAQSLLVELCPVQKEMGHEVAVLQLLDTPDKTFVQKLKSAYINVFALSEKRSERNLKNIFCLIPYLKRYDVVHVHLFPAQYWVPLAKLISFSRTALVTTEHSTNNNRRNKRIFKLIDLFIYKRYDAIVSCADRAKETFEETYKTIKCISIPNGINIKYYSEALPYSKKYLVGIPEDCFVITMVARFVYPKRQDTIVRSLQKLSDRFHAVFVGGDENDEGLIKVRNLAKKLGVDSRVHFLYIRSDIPRILKSSDVVVMSSEFEGLSLSSIEGLACGNPFVASDVNGLREVVGGAGVLVKCGDAEEMACVIRQLCEDKTYRDDVTKKCIGRAAEYDIKQVADKYVDVYYQIMN